MRFLHLRAVRERNKRGARSLRTTKSSRDAIVETLRREILSGQRPRGSRLLQDRLADDFGASITPVREALRQLESEGLLVGEPKRGMRVASVSFDDVAATYIVRRLV